MLGISAPLRSNPAVSTASCGRGAPLPLPKTLEQAILRPTTTGYPRNVGFYRAAAAAIKSDRSERTIWILRRSFS
jgi:hypothetical protein